MEILLGNNAKAILKRNKNALGHLSQKIGGCNNPDSAMECSTECKYTRAGKGTEVGYQMVHEGVDQISNVDTIVGRYVPLNNQHLFNNITLPYVLQLTFADCATTVLDAFDSTQVEIEIMDYGHGIKYLKIIVLF